jgi:AcrR family transcriptional regulator
MIDQAASPGSKRTRRTRADVVDAALGILDDQGLPDLTMRRLAEVLGVQPSALYWHFDSKQALLAAVSERILAPLAQTTTVEPATLVAAASNLGVSLRECLLAHRDGAELVSSSLALGLVPPPLHGPLTHVATSGGAPAQIAHTAAEAITHFVIGYVFHEQQRAFAASLGVVGVPGAPHETHDDDPAAAEFTAVLDLIGAGLDAALADSRV